MMSSMLATLVLALIGTSTANPLAQASKTACNADNCARAVTGTRAGSVPSATRRADCSAFQAVTVSYDQFQGTTVTTSMDDPESLPTYAASQCGYDVSRFESACSCYGVPRATTTVKFPCAEGSQVTGFETSCVFTQKCYTDVSGNLIDYNVGLGSYPECLDFCDATPGCVAAQFGYYDGFCAAYGAGYTLTNVGQDLQSASYVKDVASCGTQSD